MTVYDLPMSEDRRIGQEISPGVFLEIFKVGDRGDDVVVQLRLDRGAYWILSRQVFSLDGHPALVRINPAASADAFELFDREFQDEIDTTRSDLSSEL